ncbi:MAG: hypothetical protein V3R25_09985 [Nitrosomonadaceae bacterium]
MCRKLNNKEREEYRMYWYLCELYSRLAFKNIDRNGSIAKYDQIIILWNEAIDGLSRIKEKAYGMA